MKKLAFIFCFGLFTSGLFSQTNPCSDSLEFANLELIVYTDCWPEENTWILQNFEGDTICEGGPYNGQSVIEINKLFYLESGSYSFTFFDAAGDGLFGTQWGNQCSVNGYIALVDAGGNELLAYDGSYNFDSLHVAFDFDESVSIDENTGAQIEMSAFPNPFHDEINLSILLSAPMTTTADFVRTDGRIVQRISLGNLMSGKNDVKLSTGNLSPGYYLLRISNGQHQIVKPIVKY